MQHGTDSLTRQTKEPATVEPCRDLGRWEANCSKRLPKLSRIASFVTCLWDFYTTFVLFPREGYWGISIFGPLRAVSASEILKEQ